MPMAVTVGYCCLEPMASAVARGRRSRRAVMAPCAWSRLRLLDQGVAAKKFAISRESLAAFSRTRKLAGFCPLEAAEEIDDPCAVIEAPRQIALPGQR